MGLDRGSGPEPTIPLCGLLRLKWYYDDAKGEITFRYDRGAVTLWEHLTTRTEPELVARVGGALAAIHNADGVANGSDVFWHGDYWVGNVLYSEDRDKITIIDWANARWTLEPAERSTGSAGMDLGVAFIMLFHHRLLGPMYVPKPETLGSALLQAYKRERRCFSIGTVLPVISKLAYLRRQYWVSHRGIIRNLAYDPSLIRLRIFLSRLR